MKDRIDPTNRDTVPAMLTPGEFVVNKEATQMYADQLKAMNNNGLAVRAQRNSMAVPQVRGSIPQFNEGGEAKGNWWTNMVGSSEYWDKKNQEASARNAESIRTGEPTHSPREIMSFLPVIGDAIAAEEVYNEVSKPNPNWLLVGALSGATAVGLIPGIGPAASALIKKGARAGLSGIKAVPRIRLEVPDSATLGMSGGNMRGYLAPEKGKWVGFRDFNFDPNIPNSGIPIDVRNHYMKEAAKRGENRLFQHEDLIAQRPLLDELGGDTSKLANQWRKWLNSDQTGPAPKYLPKSISENQATGDLTTKITSMFNSTDFPEFSAGRAIGREPNIEEKRRLWRAVNKGKVPKVIWGHDDVTKIVDNKPYAGGRLTQSTNPDNWFHVDELPKHMLPYHQLMRRRKMIDDVDDRGVFQGRVPEVWDENNPDAWKRFYSKDGRELSNIPRNQTYVHAIHTPTTVPKVVTRQDSTTNEMEIMNRIQDIQGSYGGSTQVWPPNDPALWDEIMDNYNTGGLVTFLKDKEGFKGKAYPDLGWIKDKDGKRIRPKEGSTWTIGYGRISNDDGSPVKQGDTTDRKSEDVWLDNRAKKEYDAVKKFSDDEGYGWNQDQLEAFASFRFNAGSENFKMLAHKNRGQPGFMDVPEKPGYDIRYNRSTKEMIDKMPLYRNVRVGDDLIRVPGLEARRAAEVDLAGPVSYDKRYQGWEVPAVQKPIIQKPTAQEPIIQKPTAQEPKNWMSNMLETIGKGELMKGKKIPGYNEGGMPMEDDDIMNFIKNYQGKLGDVNPEDVGNIVTDEDLLQNSSDNIAGANSFMEANQMQYGDPRQSMPMPGAFMGNITDAQSLRGGVVRPDMMPPGYVPKRSDMDLMSNSWNDYYSAANKREDEIEDELALQNFESKGMGSLPPPPKPVKEIIKNDEGWWNEFDELVRPGATPVNLGLVDGKNKLGQTVVDMNQQALIDKLTELDNGSPEDQAYAAELRKDLDPNIYGKNVMTVQGDVPINTKYGFDPFAISNIENTSKVSGGGDLSTVKQMESRINELIRKQDSAESADDFMKYTNSIKKLETLIVKKKNQNSALEVTGIEKQVKKYDKNISEWKEAIAGLPEGEAKEKAKLKLESLIQERDALVGKKEKFISENKVEDATITESEDDEVDDPYKDTKVKEIVSELQKKNGGRFPANLEDAAAAGKLEAAGAKLKGTPKGNKQWAAATSFLKDLFGDLFNKKDLIRAVSIYLGARLFGASGNQAGAMAGKYYLQKQDQHEANVKAYAASGKYKPSSVAVFEKTRNIADLIAIGTPVVPTGTYKVFYGYDRRGQEIKRRAQEFSIGPNQKVWKIKVKDPKSGKYYWASFNTEGFTDDGTQFSNDETNKNQAYQQKITNLGKDIISENSKGIEDGKEVNYLPGIEPTSGGIELAKWSIDNRVPFVQSGAIVKMAVDMAKQQQAYDKDTKVEYLIDYLNKAFVIAMTDKTGVGEVAFMNKDGNYIRAGLLNNAIDQVRKAAIEKNPDIANMNPILMQTAIVRNARIEYMRYVDTLKTTGKLDKTGNFYPKDIYYKSSVNNNTTPLYEFMLAGGIKEK